MRGAGALKKKERLKMNYYEKEAQKARTEKINKLQKKHPGTRRQRSYHGANEYSVQFVDKQTGKLVANYQL